MEQQERYYPVGIQTFSEIIKGGYVYVDKTDLAWKAQNKKKYIFLSRPRRFGKSLLSTTFASFFRAEKELFEGLKIMQLEKEWIEYPVIQLDLSMAKNERTPETLQDTLAFILEPYAEKYDVAKNQSPGKILSSIIKNAYERTQRQVVVIIDEYDAPMLDVLHDASRLDTFRPVMQEFYQPLKASEAMLRFCFITGITKFSQLSIFSTINNLSNISMDPAFAAICGITEKELSENLAADTAILAEAYNETPEQMHTRLKNRYDGYHFTEDSADIYNPFSLFKAFLHKKVSNYWFETGTPSFLIRQMQHFRTDITALENITASASAFDVPTEGMTNALPLLYQAGYLTIKGYDHESEFYTLSIPNQEVRIGFTEGLMPLYIGLESNDVKVGFAYKFFKALKEDEIGIALQDMQAYVASLPYVEGFKKKLGDITKAEGFYEWTFYLIFSMLNAYVRTQVKTINGRADMVVHMPRAIYVFELKINGTAKEALQQINTKGYAIPYQTERLHDDNAPSGIARRVVKVGIRFSTETLSIEDWEIEQ